MKNQIVPFGKVTFSYFAALSLCWVCQGVVQAQETDYARPEDSRLEEVVVTARRVEESLQDTPISITAVGGEELRRRNVDRLDEVGRFTPNVTLNSAAPVSGSNSTGSFFIRGIGQSDFLLTTDPGVGVYIDGVYIPRSIGSLLELVDIEQIEVLRGPQGTLFGRNTIGGAINVSTVKPSNEFAGRFTATSGRYDRADFRASINVPVTEDFFVRATVARQERDDYVRNLLPDEPGKGDVDSVSGRLALRFVPTEQLTIDLTGDVERRRENPAPYVLIGIDDFSAFPLVWNAMAGPPCSPPPPDTTNPSCMSSLYMAGPFDTYSTYRTEIGAANDVLFLEPRNDFDSYGFSLTIDYGFGPVSVKYIGSYRDNEALFPRGQAHAPFNFFHQMNSYEYQQESHELQLAGSALNGDLTWLLGGYYSTEEGEHRDVTSFFLASWLSGGRAQSDSLAFFGQASYDVTSKLSLTAGIRWTEDKKVFYPEQYILADMGLGMALVGAPLPVGLPILPPGRQSRTYTEWTPHLSVAYSFTDDVMGYASYSQGFKSGGFVQRAFPPLPHVPSFEPETATTYELGLKTTLLADRLRLNAALFHTDYNDLQVDYFTPLGVTVTENAAKAEIRGGEVELEFLPIERMTLSGSLGYIDASYEELDPEVIQAGISIGNEFVNTPEWSASLSAAYEFSLGDAGFLTPRVDYSYRTKMYSKANNSPLSQLDELTLINASITYQTSSERLTLAIGAKNLTDKTYLVAVQDSTNGVIGLAEGLYGRPREWFATLTIDF